MTWVRLDDGFVTHPRMVAAGKDGRALFIAGLCYCGKHSTDGRIPKAAIPMLAAQAGVRPATSKRLIDAGSWIDHDTEIEVHDFLEYNPSREQTTERRAEISKKKAEAGRKGAQARWGDSKTNGNTHGKPDGTLPSARDGTAIAPSRPVPSPELSSSSNTSSNAPPGDPDDDLDQPLWNLLAQRRADHEHPDGHGINQPKPYMAKLVADHRERLSAQALELRAEHPDWTVEQLADTLDPDTAEHAGNYPTAEQTDAWLAQQTEREKQAVPMPEHLRNRAG